MGDQYFRKLVRCQLELLAEDRRLLNTSPILASLGVDLTALESHSFSFTLGSIELDRASFYHSSVFAHLC